MWPFPATFQSFYSMSPGASGTILAEICKIRVIFSTSYTFEGMLRVLGLLNFGDMSCTCSRIV